jgi:hypothetical protein
MCGSTPARIPGIVRFAVRREDFKRPYGAKSFRQTGANPTLNCLAQSTNAVCAVNISNTGALTIGAVDGLAASSNTGSRPRS